MRKAKKDNAIPRLGWRTSKKERLFYSLGFGSCVGESVMLQANLTTYLLLSGIPLSVSAFVLLFMKVVDAVDDMLFGWIVDKFHPEKNEKLKKLVGDGKYLPWLRLLFYVMPIAIIFLYNIPSTWSITAKCVWFCVFYLLAEIGYTTLDVPMQSLLTTMTENTQERDHVIFQRTLIQYAIVIVISVANTICISRYVGMSFGTTALVFCSVLAVCILPMLFGVKEHTLFDMHKESIQKNEDAPARHKVGFRQLNTPIDSLKALLSNRNLLSTYGGYIISGCLATGTAAGIFGSYYLWGSELVSLATSLPSIFVLLITMFVAQKLVQKYDKHKLRMTMLPINIVLGAVIYFIGYNNVWLYLILTMINMIPAGIASGVGNYITPECVEYGKFKTRTDCTGIQFSFITFAYKIPTAIAGSLGLWVLDLFGWQTINAESFAEVVELNIQQTPLAIQGLWFITAGLPVIGSILGYICYLFYNLKSDDAAIMAKYNCGEISREEAESMLSKKY